MTKKTTFRKPATDAILEYMHAHKTATLSELVMALPQYEYKTLMSAKQILTSRWQIKTLLDAKRNPVRRGNPRKVVYEFVSFRPPEKKNTPIGVCSPLGDIFKGYKPARVTGKGTYKGESWGNVRDGALDPNRPRIRGFL